MEKSCEHGNEPFGYACLEILEKINYYQFHKKDLTSYYWLFLCLHILRFSYFSCYYFSNLQAIALANTASIYLLV